MLVRQVTNPLDPTETWVLLRKPFQIKWFTDLSPAYRNQMINRHRYVMFHFHNGTVAERRWGDDLSDLKELFIARTAQMLGKTEEEMGLELFDMNMDLQNKDYRRNRPVERRNENIGTNLY